MDSCKTCEEEPASYCQRLLQEVGQRCLSEDSKINVDFCTNVEFCVIMARDTFLALSEEVQREQAREQAVVQVWASDVRKVI